jgi:Mn2+/Fe2+ NRAMP family transporter
VGFYDFEPPYFLLIAGLFIGLTCGLAFQETLKQFVNDWSKNRSTRSLANLKGAGLPLPFIGICVGVVMFLASGLGVFGIPTTFCYSFSLIFTILIGGLVWYQLGKILIQLEQGGSKALDLDDI